MLAPDSTDYYCYTQPDNTENVFQYEKNNLKIFLSVAPNTESQYTLHTMISLIGRFSYNSLILSFVYLNDHPKFIRSRNAMMSITFR